MLLACAIHVPMIGLASLSSPSSLAQDANDKPAINTTSIAASCQARFFKPVLFMNLFPFFIDELICRKVTTIDLNAKSKKDFFCFFRQIVELAFGANGLVRNPFTTREGTVAYCVIKALSQLFGVSVQAALLAVDSQCRRD